MKSKRINNLEFRKASYLCKELPEHISYHIDKWESNEYYGKESDFIKDGEWYRPKDYYSFCKIHENCFKNPETCYAIGSFNWDEDNYEFRFIGDRPMNLNEEERKIFWKLIDYGYKQLNPWWYKKEYDAE